MNLLELDQVSYSYRTRYQTVQALQEVSCAFERGKIYAIVGKSGCGKTTLLSLMAALDLPESGAVLYEGQPTAQLNRDDYRRGSVSVIYQSFNLFPLLSALENVRFPMQLCGVSKAQADERARQLLTRVGLPEKICHQFPKMMSGGEQQRVAIARALASEAKVILADEPTGNLDEENGQRVIEILRSLAHEDGRCVIVVTHDPDIANQCDEIVRMADGKILLEGNHHDE